jgi:hypothetical protein
MEDGNCQVFFFFFLSGLRSQSPADGTTSGRVEWIQLSQTGPMVSKNSFSYSLFNWFS